MKSPMESPIAFHVGPVPVAEAVVVTWGVVALLAVFAFIATRRLRESGEGRLQAFVELLVDTLEQQISETMGRPGRRYLPLVGSLFLFLIVANLCDIAPGIEAPTSALETPMALAVIVLFSVQYYGIRAHGLWGHLKEFAKPTPLMLPMNILSEITRTFSMMIRLFGNVMSGGFLIAVVLSLAGLFVPIPLMALEMLTGVVQAYIFAVLATVFVGAAVGEEKKGGAR
jgi:F-type H+-transporting ATPase subunit a